MNVTLAAASLATDTQSFDALRAGAARDPKSVVRQAAKQFEAIFMQQILKGMRDATVASGMLENTGTKMGTEMLDTQLAAKMSGLPGGLGDMIARQLERQMGGGAAAAPAAAAAAAPSAAAGAAAPSAAAGAASGSRAPMSAVSARQSEFLRSHQSAARAAEAETGIPAAFMVAQAAHESGWGKHQIRNADGSTSHNLFGIKATSSWKGKTAEVTTTEYVGGEPRKVTAKFRAYASYEESFRDYARMMKDSPRYSQVVANASTPQSFAQGLQKAGYATDPAYAEKLTRMINTTLRMQRVA